LVHLVVHPAVHVAAPLAGAQPGLYWVARGPRTSGTGRRRRV